MGDAPRAFALLGAAGQVVATRSGHCPTLCAASAMSASKVSVVGPPSMVVSTRVLATESERLGISELYNVGKGVGGKKKMPVSLQANVFEAVVAGRGAATASSFATGILLTVGASAVLGLGGGWLLARAFQRGWVPEYLKADAFNLLHVILRQP